MSVVCPERTSVVTLTVVCALGRDLFSTGTCYRMMTIINGLISRFRTGRHILSDRTHGVRCESALDAFRFKYPNFRRTPASVATEPMARRARALRTVAISACTDRFVTYSTSSALRGASGPGDESARRRVWNEPVGTCKYGYCSVRLVSAKKLDT